MDKIKDYFKRYRQATECFESGGRLFHTRGGAESFGNGEVERYARAEIETAAQTTEAETDVATETEAKETETKVEPEKETPAPTEIKKPTKKK